MSEKTYLLKIEKKSNIIERQTLQLSKEQWESYIGEALPNGFDISNVNPEFYDETMNGLMTYLDGNENLFELCEITRTTQNESYIATDKFGNLIYEAEWIFPPASS